MRFKRIVQDWLLSSFLTFLLYEVLWRIFAFYFYPFDDWWELGFDFLYCALFTLSSTVISHTLGKTRYFSRLTSTRQVLFCVMTLLLNLGVAFVFERIYDYFMPSPSSELFWHSYYMFCVIATLLTLVQTTYYYCMMVIRQKDELTMLQKKALKSQLDPHFVFNSLSALTELIHQNPTQAEGYVIRLSRVYRYILSRLEEDYATLSESLSFVEDYVALQEIRLPGKIGLKIDIQEEGANEYLFPLSLQLLIENAVKHNFPDEDEVLFIHILREDDEIIVRNSMKTDPEVPTPIGTNPSFGIGLETLRQRYLMEGMPEPTVKVFERWFEVRMKLVKHRNDA